WVRVSQNWAGAGWGGQVIPRIGMEVMVSYLDGDPDRPVVTGVVPNEAQKVPYELPANKTRSTFRTNTHRGQYYGFNELRLEDRERNEEIFIRAQKDLNTKVKHNRTDLTDRHSLEATFGKSIRRIGDDELVSIGGGFAIEVSSNEFARRLTESSRKRTDNLSSLYSKFEHALESPGTGNMLLDIEGSMSINTGENRTIRVGGVENKNVTGVSTHRSSGGFQINTPRKYSVDANSTLLNSAKTLTLSVGTARVTLRSDGTATIYADQITYVSKGEMNLEAKGNMRLTAGGSVTIKGKKIDLN
ncbi:type VI secretion system tip protein VgrG, partial [Paracoccaceae bacterium GXU_MW_L88]